MKLLMLSAGEWQLVSVFKGRECFAELYTWMRSGIKPNVEMDLKATLEYYEGWWQHEEPTVGHYFRNLYNLIKFVDRNDNMNYEDKKVYTNIVRAQLSSYELLLLFYNCLSKYGSEKFKPLVEEYHLLKTVPTDKLINEKHKDAYPESTFK